MYRKVSAFPVLVLFVCGLAPAHAASIFLVPTTPTVSVAPGALVSFDVIMDFSTNASGLGSDITLGGGFNIEFDNDALAFVSLTNNTSLGDPQFGREPDVLPGLLDSWAFADFQGITGPALVGSVTFEVLTTGPAISLIATRPSNAICLGFISAIDFVTMIPVDYNAVEVSRIPLPGALGLMLCAVLSLRAMPRRMQDDGRQVRCSYYERKSSRPKQ